MSEAAGAAQGGGEGAGALVPPAPVAFFGLGRMGRPMAANLRKAGYGVRGFDLAPAARTAFSEEGGEAFGTAREAVSGTRVLVTMLPDGRAVEAALFGGDDPLVAHLEAGTIVVDMSSSAPLGTRALADKLAAHDVGLVDAPVSGGVRKAVTGELSIMAGGPAALVAVVRPALERMGKAVFETGPVGSGHAAKALNNYVSAAGLLAACEALRVAQTFGIEPEMMADVMNASTGRNNATENKLKQFVIPGTFDAGFAMALMVKDLKTADDLARGLGLDVPFSADNLKRWEAAAARLPEGADHTEVDRHP